MTPDEDEEKETMLDCWMESCGRPREAGSVFCPAHEAQAVAAAAARARWTT